MVPQKCLVSFNSHFSQRFEKSPLPDRENLTQYLKGNHSAYNFDIVSCYY